MRANGQLCWQEIFRGKTRPGFSGPSELKEWSVYWQHHKLGTVENDTLAWTIQYMFCPTWLPQKVNKNVN